jgi:hypothetical protein
MKLLVILAAAALLASAQTPATISGTVTGPNSAPVSGAPVQAKNVKTAATFRAISTPKGAYTLTGVPAGTYEISVFMPGFAFNPFAKTDLALTPAQKLAFDIRLEDGNLSTIGDDPYTYNANIRDQAVKLKGPTPRTAWGTPDLSGVWNGKNDLFPEQPDLLPWAAAILQTRLANAFKDTPSAYCLPSSILYVGPFLRKFVQTSKLLVILNEDDVVGFRQIYLDGRAHPKDLNPTWMGHAIGHWERDTLVVDATGFNEESWLDIYPHTAQLHVTERYHRRDFGHMDVQFLIDDPGTFSKPWKVNMTWDLAPKEDILENVCTENNSYTRHVQN